MGWQILSAGQMHGHEMNSGTHVASLSVGSSVKPALQKPWDLDGTQGNASSALVSGSAGPSLRVALHEDPGTNQARDAGRMIREQQCEQQSTDFAKQGKGMVPNTSSVPAGMQENDFSNIASRFTSVRKLVSIYIAAADGLLEKSSQRPSRRGGRVTL